MLKHIPIPNIPPPSSTAASTTFATTPTSRPSRPLLTLNRSQQPLNVSTLTSASNITSNGGPSLLQTYSNTPLLTHSFPDGAHTKTLQNGHAPRMFTPLPALSSNSQQFLLKNYNHNHNNMNNISNATSSSSSSKLFLPESNGAREALTSLGLLCLGESSALIVHQLVLIADSCSFASSCPAVADFPAEDIARHQIVPQHPAATAGLVCGRVRDRVRRDSSAVRAVALAEPLLPAGVRDPISVRG